MTDGDGSEEARLRLLRRVVIGLGIVLGLMALAVFSTLAVRLVKGRPTPAHGPAATVEAALPAGARVIGTAMAEGRLAVAVEAEGRFVVILFDLATLREVGRVRLVPER